MTRVFISGSMRIRNIDNNVLERINNIIASQYEVIVGDADGVDSSIQSYLQSKDVRLVTVYCSGRQPRNNIGHWDIKSIETDAKPGTREFFTAKDIVMANDSNYGLMIWDAKSTGTLSNCIELLKRNKSSLVYINKTKEFITVKSVDDLKKLLAFMSEAAFFKADLKLKINYWIESFQYSQASLFVS
jgi:hypothetical protein